MQISVASLPIFDKEHTWGGGGWFVGIFTYFFRGLHSKFKNKNGVVDMEEKIPLKKIFFKNFKKKIAL